MEKIPIKNETIWMNNIHYKINFFQIIKSPNQISYCSEITFGSFDKIILDDEDLGQLEIKTRLILPIAHQSRVVSNMLTSKVG